MTESITSQALPPRRPIRLSHLWREERANYEGKHYQLVDAICEPKPLQKPNPPVWIGGRGKKILLKIVAKYADVWNYNGSIDEFDETVEILKSHCRDVGRDFDEIRCTAMANGICWDSDEELDGFFTSIEAQGMDRDALLSFVGCKGSRQECADFIGNWKAKGCDGLVFFFSDIASVGSGTSQAEVFMRDVFPKVG